MNELSNKCGSCGYTLTFDAVSQMLKCSHCGSLANINKQISSTYNNYDQNIKLKINDTHSNVFMCDSCGAKTNAKNNITGICPYCGSANLKEFSEAFKFKADGVIPFKIDKKSARKRYRAWIKKCHFVPNKLKNYAKLNKMEGYYFPCYSYCFDAFSSYSGIGVREHHITRTINTPNGPQVVTSVKTTTHPFSGTRDDSFKDLLINANDTLNLREVKKLGNFGLEELNVFNPAYLLGFITKEQTLDVHNCFNQAITEAKQDIESSIEFEHSYDRIQNLTVKTNFTNKKYNYIYLPVWICNFIYKQKEYKFLVNGYSGFVTGKVPRSGWKIAGLVLGILLGLTAVGLLIAYFVK